MMVSLLQQQYGKSGFVLYWYAWRKETVSGFTVSLAFNNASLFHTDFNL